MKYQGKKVKGDGTKKKPQSILKNKGTPAASKKSTPKKSTPKKSTSKESADAQGASNNDSMRAKGKKKQRKRSISFDQKKAGKPQTRSNRLHATRETHENFEFIPNITISIHLNARHVLGKIPTGVYFTHFTNKQSHDLTMKKSIPAAAATVLGLGLKFIPVPKKSIRPDDINEALKQIDRDVYLNVHFANDDADSDDEEPIEKLQVNSKWMLDQPPFDITQRLGNFEGAITRNFRP
jgi:hypothetical protein